MTTSHPLLLRLVVHSEGSRDLLPDDGDLGELGGGAAGHLRHAELENTNKDTEKEGGVQNGIRKHVAAGDMNCNAMSAPPPFLWPKPRPLRYTQRNSGAEMGDGVLTHPSHIARGPE